MNPATRSLAENLGSDLDRHFDGLVTKYQQPLFAYAYRMSGNSRDAEEVVQDVFIRAYRALAEYPPERIRAMALTAWLYRICINQVRNRRRRMTPVMVEFADHMGESSDHGDPVADAYTRQESDVEMQGLVARLPATYRSAVVLRFVNELSYAEIAAALDLPEGTIKSNVHRGLKLLRSFLEGGDASSVTPPRGTRGEVSPNTSPTGERP